MVLAIGSVIIGSRNGSAHHLELNRLRCGQEVQTLHDDLRSGLWIKVGVKVGVRVGVRLVLRVRV